MFSLFQKIFVIIVALSFSSEMGFPVRTFGCNYGDVLSTLSILIGTFSLRKNYIGVFFLFHFVVGMLLFFQLFLFRVFILFVFSSFSFCLFFILFSFIFLMWFLSSSLLFLYIVLICSPYQLNFSDWNFPNSNS